LQRVKQYLEMAANEIPCLPGDSLAAQSGLLQRIANLAFHLQAIGGQRLNSHFPTVEPFWPLTRTSAATP
jgi:hypothetical protein